MNQIQTALTTALRVKPVTELVWAELNAHSKSTSKQIAGRLKLKENRVAAALTEMALRGMVKSRVDAPRRISNGTMRAVKEWWCVYTTYERLPRPPKTHKANKVKEYHAKHPLVPPVAPATVIAAPVPLAEAEPTPGKVPVKESDLLGYIDSLELRTALAIYKHLHVIFNHDRKA